MKLKPSGAKTLQELISRMVAGESFYRKYGGSLITRYFFDETNTVCVFRFETTANQDTRISSGSYSFTPSSLSTLLSLAPWQDELDGTKCVLCFVWDSDQPPDQCPTDYIVEHLPDSPNPYKGSLGFTWKYAKPIKISDLVKTPNPPANKKEVV